MSTNSTSPTRIFPRQSPVLRTKYSDDCDSYVSIADRSTTSDQTFGSKGGNVFLGDVTEYNDVIAQDDSAGKQEQDRKGSSNFNKINKNKQGGNEDKLRTTRKSGENGSSGGRSVCTLSSSEFNLSSLRGRGNESTTKDPKAEEGSCSAVRTGDEPMTTSGPSADVYDDVGQGAGKDDGSEDGTVAMMGCDDTEGTGDGVTNVDGVGNDVGKGSEGTCDVYDTDEDDDSDGPSPPATKCACQRAKCVHCSQYKDKCFEVVFGTYCLFLAVINKHDIGSCEADTPLMNCVRFISLRTSLQFISMRLCSWGCSTCMMILPRLNV